VKGEHAIRKDTRTLPVAFLQPGRFQPRKTFDEQPLSDLAASIKEKGVLSPILVRPIGPDRYEIVAGERRWRAAQIAQLHDVPVVVRELPDDQALEIAIIENVQRTDLNAIEEGAAYDELVTRFGRTQEDVAREVGKSRSHVANTLRLTQLPEHARALLAGGQISAGHARALLAVGEGLTVRDVESLGANAGKSARHPAKKAPTIDADTAALQEKLSLALGTKVAIRHAGGESGEIRVAFQTFDQLDDFCRRLAQPAGR